MKKIMLQEIVKVAANRKVGEDYFKLILRSKAIAACALPGQFIQIRVSAGDDPLLRRPVSIHRVNADTLEALCEIVGKGTQLLSAVKDGDCLDVIGPLGNGFDYGDARAPERNVPVLVAGGMGIAPLVFLAQKLRKHKPLALIGARTKKQVLCAGELKKQGCKVMIATDDGSLGFKGRVTDLLEDVLRRNLKCSEPANPRTQEPKNRIYACGPRPMLKEISRISAGYNIPAQISLEEHMSCGIGACLGCVVDTKAGYKRVCKDGPVFEAQEITW